MVRNTVPDAPRAAVFQTIWETDHRGMNHYQSPNWYHYVGEAAGSSYGKDWLQFYHPDDREFLQNEWRNSLESGGAHPYDIEVRIRRHDGAYRWFRVQGSPLRSKEGAVVKWTGTCTDIHEHKIRDPDEVADDAGASVRARPQLTARLRALLRLGPLERRLFWIVFVALLPLTLLAFATLLHTAGILREQSIQAAEITLGNVLQGVDREVDASLAALDALASSPRLQGDDFAGFHAEASALLARRPNWANVVLSDPAAHQLVNARIPFGASLPSRISPQAVAETARTGRGGVTELVFSPVLKAYAFGVRVPVFRNDRVAYVLTAVIKPSAVQQIIASQRVSQDAVITVLDQLKHMVGRSLNEESWIGKPPSATLQTVMQTAQPGAWSITTTLEGVPVYTMFDVSQRTQWTAAIGIPTSTLNAPVYRSYFVLGSSVLGSFLLGLLVAFITGRTITRPMRELEHAASSMAQGRPPSVPTTELPEIRHAALALLSAHTEREKLLQSERESRLLEQQARFAAESASKAKDEFLAMLGHELRNPLAAISNASQLLEHSQRAQSQQVAQEANAIVRRQVAHLTRLTDDLLDAGRVMLGKISLDRQPLDFAMLVESVIETLRRTGRLSEHSLSVNLEKLWIRADATRMDQIVANLLTNAVKYTPPTGSISVSLAREGDQAVLRVADTGVGLEPELLPRVFELFVQGRRSLDRSQGGLGIGLALVKRLIDLHGGSVTAHSAGADRGSEFVVRLPLTDAPASFEIAAQSTNPQSTRKIVLIEDNADVRIGLKRFLELSGHQVWEAEDGEQGLKVIREVRPDIAIIDIGLPSLNGYELARAIRAEHIPVLLIAMTGYGSADDAERGRDAGFDRYLVKPVNFDLLEQILAEH